MTDDDIHNLQLKADQDQDGYVSWHEFRPVAILMLKDIFTHRDWEAMKQNPWLMLSDENGAHYW